MKQLFETDNKGVFRLYPHRFQYEALVSEAARIFVLKGMQGGATSLMPHWLMQEMRRCGPGNRGLSYLGITPTLQVARNKLIPEIQRVFCDHFGYGTIYQNPKPRIQINKRGERDLWGHEQKEPTDIYFCYAEEPDSFAGYTALAAFGDEIGQKKFKSSAWMELQARLSTPSGAVAPNNAALNFSPGVKMGRFCGGSTVYQLGWLEDLWNEWEKAVAEGRPTPLHFIRFDSTENPAFPREMWEIAQATLPDWLFDMRYRAIFRRPAGLIYDCWDPATMVIDPQPHFSPDNLPPHFTVDVAMDFGRRNFRAGYWAEDPRTDRHWLIGSYRDSEKSNEDRAKDIIAYANERGWKIDSACGGQPSEKTEREEMGAGGLLVLPPAYKPLWQGINNFYAAIKLGKVKTFRDVCPGFEDEMRNYSRPIDENGNVLLDEDPEDKETYHDLDWARYRFTRKFNPLLSSGSSMARAGGDKDKTPTAVGQNSAISHTEAIRAGNSTAPRSRQGHARRSFMAGHLDT